MSGNAGPKVRRERHSVVGRPDLLDATRVHGGEFVLCTEQGNESFGSLAPQIGEQVTVWVVAYCAGDGHGRKQQRVGEVEEWIAATGEKVIPFRGRDFVALPGGEDRPPQAESTYALLDPSHGTPLRTSCPNHGPLTVSEALIRRHLAHGRYQHANRSGAATRKIKLGPAPK